MISPLEKASWEPIERWPGDATGKQYFFVFDAVSNNRISILNVKDELADATKWVADRLVNYSETEQYKIFKRILRADGSEIASKILGKLLLEVEQLSTQAFFQKIRVRIKDDPELLRLAAISEDSMQVRWSLQNKSQRTRENNRQNALQRRPPFSKEDLIRTLENQNGAGKRLVIAHALGVSIMTLRKWAAIYGVTIPGKRRSIR